MSGFKTENCPSLLHVWIKEMQMYHTHMMVTRSALHSYQVVICKESWVLLQPWKGSKLSAEVKSDTRLKENNVMLSI